MKNLVTLNNNAQNCLPSCRIEKIVEETAQNLVPHLCLPFSIAFYMPEAVNVHSERYLQALFLACKSLVNKSLFSSGYGRKEINLRKQTVQKLAEFEGQYDGVIICLGARVNMLPEIAGILPLRTCRGVIVHMELPEDIGASYPDHGPSILSDAWLAIQGPRHICLGSTWEWKSSNSSQNVSADEASKALVELMPKASAIYPAIKDWIMTGARAGLRAMPPLTSVGSLPLLGSINDVIDGNFNSKFWLFGGLGSRGLLYHAWLGKLMAQAVLSCNEQVIPSELTSWKNAIQSHKERVRVL